MREDAADRSEDVTEVMNQLAEEPGGDVLPAGAAGSA